MDSRASSHTDVISGSQDVSDILDSQDDNVEILEEPNWCYEVLISLLKNPSTHDAMFVTSDGGSVSGHKAILAASSPVFHAMFYDNVHNSREMEISLPSVNAEIFTSLLNYIYTGKVSVNSATCLNMLGAAMQFEIASLVLKLTIFTTASLDSSNVISVATFACKRNCSQLLDNCLKHICANGRDVVHDPDFIKLPHEIVLALCKSSDLNVSEIDLFLAVNKWQQHNQKIAKAITKNIFREIRYPLISSTDLLSKVAPTKMADPSLYTAALEYHFNASIYRGPSSQLITREFHNITYLGINRAESSAGMYICSVLVYNIEMVIIGLYTTVSSSYLVDTEDRFSINKLDIVVKSVSPGKYLL